MLKTGERKTRFFFCFNQGAQTETRYILLLIAIRSDADALVAIVGADRAVGFPSHSKIADVSCLGIVKGCVF